MTAAHSRRILLIDTAQQDAVVAISERGAVTDNLTNPIQMEHASFLHVAIESLCRKHGLALHDFDAIAVMNGPGSYTGLRVGLSAAKGICYALNKPLICINSLNWMAYGNLDKSNALICPMIDARRMEVFTACFDGQMNLIIPHEARILEEQSFHEQLNASPVVFVGNGAPKWQDVCRHPNARFPEGKHSLHHFAEMADKQFQSGLFENLAYIEPFYTKGFHSTIVAKTQ